MIADGMIFVMNDDGLLATVEANPKAYRPIARAQVIENGYESWGPMAMAAGRLIVRDMTRMVCLKVSENKSVVYVKMSTIVSLAPALVPGVSN
jgi:outer membrane protein assembly factor BamB